MLVPTYHDGCIINDIADERAEVKDPGPTLRGFDLGILLLGAADGDTAVSFADGHVEASFFCVQRYLCISIIPYREGFAGAVQHMDKKVNS